jgi:hypothetical protein
MTGERGTAYEIVTNYVTVWVNGAYGLLGRFGIQGIDVHQPVENQAKAGECLHCTREKTTRADWDIFTAKMLEHHNIVVDDGYMPRRFRVDESRSSGGGDRDGGGLRTDPECLPDVPAVRPPGPGLREDGAQCEQGAGDAPGAVPGGGEELLPGGEVALVYTRRQMRSRRKREVRAETVPLRRVLPQVRAEMGVYPFEEYNGSERPKLRSECENVQRPCPFISCRHNLFLDVDPRKGSIKFNFPDLEPSQMKESCALDIADKGGETLEAVGEVMNLTRERVRQLENNALSRPHVKRALREWKNDG